jgi:plasmid maintenance system antidote protein VapI
MENNWSEILKKEMKERSLSQKDLSTLIGVDIFTFNRWVNEHTKPSTPWQIQLKRVLKTEVAS